MGIHSGSLSGMNSLLSSTISKATQHHKKIDSLFSKNDTTKVKLGSLLSISFSSKIPMLIFVVTACRCLRGALRNLSKPKQESLICIQIAFAFIVPRRKWETIIECQSLLITNSVKKSINAVLKKSLLALFAILLQVYYLPYQKSICVQKRSEIKFYHRNVMISR